MRSVAGAVDYVLSMPPNGLVARTLTMEKRKVPGSSLFKSTPRAPKSAPAKVARLEAKDRADLLKDWRKHEEKFGKAFYALGKKHRNRPPSEKQAIEYRRQEMHLVQFMHTHGMHTHGIPDGERQRILSLVEKKYGEGLTSQGFFARLTRRTEPPAPHSEMRQGFQHTPPFTAGLIPMADPAMVPANLPRSAQPVFEPRAHAK